MAQDYASHLAAAVLNDGRFVSYRLLSRDLRVHSNVAKRMLYDFHHRQNAKKPGSVHATYLIDGAPKTIRESHTNGHQPDGNDGHMQSSPFMSSAVAQDEKEEEAVPSRSIVLAREGDLEMAKAQFERIQSVHIYSLQPNTLQSLQVLSDCNRTVSTQFASEDPLVAGQQYGVIHNNGVRRRTARRPLANAPSVPAAKVVEKPTLNAPGVNKGAPKAAPPSSQESAKSEAKSDQLKSSGKRSVGRPAGKTIVLKKEQSDIFKSFSKPKPKLVQETTGSSTAESPSSATLEDARPQEDEPMRDASDDDDEEDFVATNKADEKLQNARSERAEQLRKMMEDDDEEMAEIGEDAPDASQDSAAIDKPTPRKEPTPEPPPVLSGGRRRGRRKVMKKKTVKDEEGYLVTKEEASWESFSEEEPAPQKERAPVSSATASKGKKSSAKPGQGNIMSFFGKK